MQRSTISLIVEELIEENWVVEGPMGRLPRGRRPTYLQLNDERAIVGVDVRPVQTTIALADINGRFSAQEVMPTPDDPKIALEEIIIRIRSVVRGCKGKKVEGIGISLPGRYDRAADRLVFAPNLKWRDVDLRTPIASATGIEVELENAANACVLAAVWFDRMDAIRDLVVLTVSEGIGAGLLVNGQLARGRRSMAGEFGHIAIDPEGPPCSCGSRGCWEVFASNRAAVRYYLEADAGSQAVNFLDLLSLADQGNAKAAAALETMARYLGEGMRIMVAGLAPERILIVGDLTRSWHRFGPVLEKELNAQALPGGEVPKIIPVHEDGMARLRGTVALVLQKHFSASREAAF